MRSQGHQDKSRKATNLGIKKQMIGGPAHLGCLSRRCISGACATGSSSSSTTLTPTGSTILCLLPAYGQDGHLTPRSSPSHEGLQKPSHALPVPLQELCQAALKASSLGVLATSCKHKEAERAALNILVKAIEAPASVPGERLAGTGPGPNSMKGIAATCASIHPSLTVVRANCFPGCHARRRGLPLAPGAFPRAIPFSSLSELASSAWPGSTGSAFWVSLLRTPVAAQQAPPA